MNELLARVRDFYVTPDTSVSQPRVRVAAPPPCAAVLGQPRPAAVLAAAAAVELARAGGWPCALVGFWRTEEGRDWRLPPRRPARRLAARLSAQGLEPEASGRLARIWLPDDAVLAVADAERAIAAARVPTAIALAGPREPELDALLRVQDVVVLARPPQADPALDELARDSLAGLSPATVVCAVSAGPAARALALAGAAVPSVLRGALRPALEAVS